MPRYIIIRIKGKGRTQQTVTVGITIPQRSVRSAWVYYKKNFKRSLKKEWEYHLFPINHSRSWKHNGTEWLINSWYGNHNRDDYNKKRLAAYKKTHNQRIKS